MIGFQEDDGGRKSAGFKGESADCVTRAIAIATCGEYMKVYKDLADRMHAIGNPRTARNGISKKVSRPAFLDYGFTKAKLPKGPRPTWTEAWETYGNCIVTTNAHVAALIDGKLRDNHDCRTYTWTGEDGTYERERKAASVYYIADR